MPFPVSFMSANFVGRQAGWPIADWGEGDRAGGHDRRLLDGWLGRRAA